MGCFEVGTIKNVHGLMMRCVNCERCRLIRGRPLKHKTIKNSSSKKDELTRSETDVFFTNLK
jgi:hypothetical protein